MTTILHADIRHPHQRSIATMSGKGEELATRHVHRHRSAVKVCTIPMKRRYATDRERDKYEQRWQDWYGPGDDKRGAVPAPPALWVTTRGTGICG